MLKGINPFPQNEEGRGVLHNLNGIANCSIALKFFYTLNPHTIKTKVMMLSTLCILKIIYSEQSDVDTSLLDLENESEGKSSNVNKKSKKGKCGRKASWSTDTLNDLVDIITCNERYQRKLIFTNTKNQNNGIIYGEILNKLKERANERGEQITFTIQQIRTKFKRCVSDCKQAAMTIKTATGIQRFQDEKGYGKWFDLLFPLVKTRDSCQPAMAVEPSAINDLTEEEEVEKTFEDIVPRKKMKLPKKNTVAEAVDLLKQVVEKDPAKELITFMQEEAEKARKHELQLVELMLKHNSSNTSNHVNNFSPPQDIPAIHPTAVQGIPQGLWNAPHQNFSFQSAENPMYNMSTVDQSQRFFYPPVTSGHGNSFISPSQGHFQR